MKPAKSQLKRTNLKRGKPVSQRKNRDASAIREYMESHPYCEFEQSGAYTGPGGHFCIDGYEPHHLARIKKDDHRILHSICTNCHDLHRHDPSFVVICLWHKMEAGLLDKEAFEFYREHSRCGCLVAYIQRDHEWIEDGIVDMRDAVVRHARKAKYLRS